jgi:hypothetical protein
VNAVVNAINRKIDALVYGLYGLTEEEIAGVEGADYIDHTKVVGD